MGRLELTSGEEMGERRMILRMDGRVVAGECSVCVCVRLSSIGKEVHRDLTYI